MSTLMQPQSVKSQLVKPHGSEQLLPLALTGAAREQAIVRAQTLPRLHISSREAGDVLMLGIGGFTPLTGFMGEADWRGVCTQMRCANGLFWPIPITLSATPEQAAGFAIGAEIALWDTDGEELLAILTLSEKYRIDKALECREVFRTTDPAHPGVAMVMQQGEVNLAGDILVIGDGHFPQDYPGVYLTPAQTRELFELKKWYTVAAFQTRNPMHRSHEHLVKSALELCDGVLIHSLLGQLKPGDIPAEVRQEAISVLVEHYFVKDTVMQAGYPLDMRYAGPREALLHALFRQNYGCSHLIVGRDHAGVGDFYGPFDAQRIFDEIPAGSLLTQPLKFEWAFWCNTCDGMATQRSCPHTDAERVIVSGTKLRKLLAEDQPVPDHFSRPEVLKVLQKYYAGLTEKVEVKLSGHSAR